MLKKQGFYLSLKLNANNDLLGCDQNMGIKQRNRKTTFKDMSTSMQWQPKRE